MMQEDKGTKETEANAAEEVSVSGEETKPAVEEIAVDGEGAASAAETEAEGPKEEPAQQSAETSDSAGEGAPEAAPEENPQGGRQSRAETDAEKREAERAEAMRRRREEWMLENERERERLIAESLRRHRRMEEEECEKAGPTTPSGKDPGTEESRAETDAEKREAERAEAMRRRREERMRMKREQMLDEEREYERLAAERRELRRRMEAADREKAGSKTPSGEAPGTEESRAETNAEKRETERAEAMRRRREERMRMKCEQMLDEEREYERLAAESRELRRRMEEEERENDCREEASWRRTVISRHREAPHRDDPEGTDLTLEAMRAALADERHELRRQRESLENLESWGAICPHECGALRSVLDEREQELEWKAEAIRASLSKENADSPGGGALPDPLADEPAQMFERDWARLMHRSMAGPGPDGDEGRRPPHGCAGPHSVYEGEFHRREMALRREIRSVERERTELYKRMLGVRHARGRDGDMSPERRQPGSGSMRGIEARYRQLAWELTQREWALRGDIARMRAERDGRPEPPPPHPGHGRPGGRCDGPGGPGRHERAGGPDGPDRRH